MAQEIAKIEFTEDQKSLIKSQIAPKATDAELQLFLYQCKRTGLDPLVRQIYAIHRKVNQNGNWTEKMTIQTSIDGFRVVAERSGDYGGQDEPEYIYDDQNNLIKAIVRVFRFRGDIRYQAAVGVAYWKEYVPSEKQDAMWKKMPHTMLAKVAEALALRKAYPQDLSGLYTNDEMNQADAPITTEDADFSDIPDEKEKDYLRGLAYKATMTESERLLALESINNCIDYKRYEKIEHRLNDLQPSIDEIINPSQTDIKNHINAVIS